MLSPYGGGYGAMSPYGGGYGGGYGGAYGGLADGKGGEPRHCLTDGSIWLLTGGYGGYGGAYGGYGAGSRFGFF
jgi:hypothetical protein